MFLTVFQVLDALQLALGSCSVMAQADSDERTLSFLFSWDDGCVSLITSTEAQLQGLNGQGALADLIEAARSGHTTEAAYKALVAAMGGA